MAASPILAPLHINYLVVDNAGRHKALEFGHLKNTGKLISYWWMLAPIDALGKLMQAEGICHTSPKAKQVLQNWFDY